jgi:glyoxylate reductase
MKVLITGRIPDKGINIFGNEIDVTINEFERPMVRERLLELIKDKDGLLCMLNDKIDEELLENAVQLKMIANYAVGFDNIDIEAATARKIPVSNTPGVLTDATADLAFALILCVSRRVVEGDRVLREEGFHQWAPQYFLGREVSGKTLGIVGFGRIGKAVAKRANGFNMKIIYYSRRRLDISEEKKLNVEYSGLKKLLSNADFVSLHVPLSEETKHFVGKDELKLMKKTSYLINTSRGPVIDEKALVDTLQSGDIAGAGLDVYENEPLLSPGLVEIKNAVLIPHIGSATIETRTKMAIKASTNLLTGLKGNRPPDCLNWDLL